MGYDGRCMGNATDFCNFLYILTTFDKMHNTVLERYKLKCPLPLFPLFDYPSGEQASRVIDWKSYSKKRSRAGDEESSIM